MDFKFIDMEKTKAVISCKSFLTTTEIDKEYCSDLSPFTNQVWLFAECCGPKSAAKIKQEVIRNGYKGFWHLYTWNRNSGDIGDSLTDWDNFVETIRALH